VTTMAAPLLITSDRVVIGAMLSPGAVAAYVIPYNLVTRLSIVPSSLASALFPRFSYADAAERKRLIADSSAAVAVIITPLAIVGAGLVPPFFELWIGDALAAQATPVALILVVGAWVNAFGQVPFSMIQASGRPDLVSKLLLAEVIPYWTALLMGIHAFGLAGAAAAWALRALVDTSLLYLLARVGWRPLRSLAVPGALVVAAVLAAALIERPLVYAAVAGLAGVSLLWAIFNMPDVIRSRLGAKAQWLPRARSAGRMT
ncbi:MAG TPA: hypothetical protein VE891_08450, partial [Allosphingosinicella sp.]|nr:hypothetical protein [Allosphingosinicella sp.]